MSKDTAHYGLLIQTVSDTEIVKHQLRVSTNTVFTREQADSMWLRLKHFLAELQEDFSYED